MPTMPRLLGILGAMQGDAYLRSPSGCRSLRVALPMSPRRPLQTLEPVTQGLRPRPTSCGRALNFSASQTGKPAFGKLSIRAVQKGARDEDPELVQDVHWHQVRSQRYKTVEAGLSEEMVVILTMCCIAFEPLRFLTRWWLWRGSTKRRAARQLAGGVSPMCDMIWPAGSPAIRVLQYLSFLLG